MLKLFIVFLRYKLLLVAFCFFSILLNAQDGFRFLKKYEKHEQISFKLINNLIVIPVKINGKELSFILDSGVTKTILFNFSENDSIGLRNIKNIELQGLGAGKPVKALLSKNNKISVKGIVNYNETIHIILKDYFDLSGKMGTTIHGIIGYSFFKNFILKLNFKSNRIDIYKPETYTYKKCKKCEVFPLQFYRKKPFIDVKVQLDTIGKKLTNVKVLIDTGGSDALWLFEDTKNDIKTPQKHFRDLLGEGLSGPIYGNRSRLQLLKIGDYEIKEPTVSFLDNATTFYARKFKERNGSIGSGILKRFKLWIDYPNKKIVFKKNGSFSKGFNYDMSGLDIVYHGKELVRERDKTLASDYRSQNLNVHNNNTIDLVVSFSYKFKPLYRIKRVLENSPAAKAGLAENDIIIKINGQPAYEYKFSEIIQKLQEKDGKKIRMIVKRKDQYLTFEFRLKKKV